MHGYICTACTVINSINDMCGKNCTALNTGLELFNEAQNIVA